MADRTVVLPDPQTCRGRRCAAAVRFVPAAHSDKTMCLNADPHPTKGNVWLRDVGDGDGLRAQAMTKDAAASYRSTGTPMYLAHHATCVDVEEFRRG